MRTLDDDRTRSRASLQTFSSYRDKEKSSFLPLVLASHLRRNEWTLENERSRCTQTIQNK